MTKVDTRIGKLSSTHDFANGNPTKETVITLFDVMNLPHACPAYPWSLPFVSFAQWETYLLAMGNT